MAAGDQDRAGELRISLGQLLVVQDEEAADDYRDNYVRRMSGPILLSTREPEQEVKIGEVELLYFDGSRAVILVSEHRQVPTIAINARMATVGIGGAILLAVLDLQITSAQSV